MKISAFAASALLVAFSTSARADDPFFMTTQWQGPDMVLTVIDSGPYRNYLKLEKLDGSKAVAQTWQAWVDDGWIRFTNETNGGHMCIDVDNGGELDNYVSVTSCDTVSGQFWKRTDAGDFNKLKTQFRGEAMCLDIVRGGETEGMAHLAPCDDVKGQLWGGSRAGTENAKNIPSSPQTPELASGQTVKR